MNETENTDEEGIVVGNTFLAWASLYPDIMRKHKATPEMKPYFKVYYQYNAPDHDPEFLTTTETLHDAWKFVYELSLEGHMSNPNEVHPDLYHKLPNRMSMTSNIKAAFFDQPKELKKNDECLICISNYDMYFVMLA